MSACNCISVINGALKARVGESAALDVDLVRRNQPDGSTNLCATIPAARFTYVTGKRKKAGKIALTHCPFCGQKLEAA